MLRRLGLQGLESFEVELFVIVLVNLHLHQLVRINVPKQLEVALLVRLVL